MKTVMLEVKEPFNEDDNIKKAVEVIKLGGLVVFPTETVFGLGANALNREACLNIYKAKNRPSDNPLIIHLADKSDITLYALEIPDYAKSLIDNLCPGPVTFLFKKSDKVPYWVTANQETVCIRIPNHPVALELLRQSNLPIAAPSANTSTRPSATTAIDAYSDLNNKVNIILDSDIKPLGIESTIIDCTQKAPKILRAGAATVEQISILTKTPISVLKSNNASEHVTPGSKYKHYAPNLELVALTHANINSKLFKIEIDKALNANKKFRLIGKTVSNLLPLKSQTIYKNDDLYMQNLFADFRKAEKDGLDVIFVEMAEEENLGLGINDRIKKAATKIL